MKAIDRSLLTERALLTLLLLVGAGALASGLYQVLANPTPPPAGLFDAVLGTAVLLMTWLFLAPYVAPHAFGDLSPGEAPMRRPYLLLPIAPATAGGGPSLPVVRQPDLPKAETRRSTSEPEAEVWREPESHPDSRPASKELSREPFDESELVRQASTPVRTNQKPSATDPPPSSVPSPAFSTQDALKELDSIVQEFREAEPTPGEPAPSSDSDPPKSPGGKKKSSSTPA